MDDRVRISVLLAASAAALIWSVILSDWPDTFLDPWLIKDILMGIGFRTLAKSPAEGAAD